MITVPDMDVYVKRYKKETTENCFNHRLLKLLFRITCASTEREDVTEWLPLLPYIFAMDTKILIPEDWYGPPLSTYTKKKRQNKTKQQQQQQQRASSPAWRFDDVRVTTPDFADLRFKYADFSIFSKNPWNMYFGGLIMKENDYYIIQRKFQVHSTNVLGLEANTNIVRWQPSPP